MSKINFSVKELLQHVSKGQMIRLIFLYDDGEETGSFLEFENDKLDLELPNVKKYLDNYVIFLSSTFDDYLRIEIFY